MLVVVLPWWIILAWTPSPVGLGPGPGGCPGGCPGGFPWLGPSGLHPPHKIETSVSIKGALKSLPSQSYCTKNYNKKLIKIQKINN